MEGKMITLYGFGPLFDLPDPSPFVMKAEVQLKMAGVPYRWERGGPQGAPKGKVPYIEDGGARVGDSTFIRDHVERKTGVDLDATLTTAQRAQAWAIERMIEDHLYFALLYTRWMIDENFDKGPSQFFKGAPDTVRDGARLRVRDNLNGHGIGRHSEEEIIALASRTLASLSALLGDKPCLLGKEPCSVDATAFGMLAGILTPFFDTRLRDEALSHKNLVAYTGRMMAKYYPDFAKQQAA
jgi:glutathione S-transferase